MSPKECTFTDCKLTINSNRWARIKAHAAGWYFTQDDKIFCPSHVPSWVSAWRSRIAEAK